MFFVGCRRYRQDLTTINRHREGAMPRHDINIQDSWLFQSLREKRPLNLVLTCQQCRDDVSLLGQLGTARWSRFLVRPESDLWNEALAGALEERKGEYAKTAATSATCGYAGTSTTKVAILRHERCRNTADRQ